MAFSHVVSNLQQALPEETRVVVKAARAPTLTLAEVRSVAAVQRSRTCAMQRATSAKKARRTARSDTNDEMAANKNTAVDDDADVTCALYIIAFCGVMIALLLAGMQTGYTPCYFMETYGGAKSCHG